MRDRRRVTTSLACTECSIFSMSSMPSARCATHSDRPRFSKFCALFILRSRPRGEQMPRFSAKGGIESTQPRTHHRRLCGTFVEVFEEGQRCVLTPCLKGGAVRSSWSPVAVLHSCVHRTRVYAFLAIPGAAGVNLCC